MKELIIGDQSKIILKIK